MKNSNEYLEDKDLLDKANLAFNEIEEDLETLKETLSTLQTSLKSSKIFLKNN